MTVSADAQIDTLVSTASAGRLESDVPVHAGRTLCGAGLNDQAMANRRDSEWNNTSPQSQTAFNSDTFVVRIEPNPPDRGRVVTTVVPGVDAAPHEHCERAIGTDLLGATVDMADAIDSEPTEKGSARLAVVVSLSRPSRDRVTVRCATLSETTPEGADFASGSTTVVFEPGETSRKVIVVVQRDVLAEPVETMTVRFNGPLESSPRRSVWRLT